ncbi:MAG: hypothetical protein NXI00_06160 [Cytophagales bacterium]|nr:hypothetical protein [Cytophagales bacterium]
MNEKKGIEEISVKRIFCPHVPVQIIPETNTQKKIYLIVEENTSLNLVLNKAFETIKNTPISTG